MKTTLYISSLLLFSSPIALGASLSLECANGQLTTNIQIDAGEVCNGMQTVTINGMPEETTLSNDNLPDAPIDLEPTDTVNASATLTCEINGGSNTLSDTVSNTQGCSGGSDGNDGGDGGDGGDGNNDNTQTVRVTLTNLTRGSYFTPLAAAIHPQDIYLFRVGETASEGLQVMAEGGNTMPMLSSLPEGVLQPEIALSTGLLGPGQTTSGETLFTVPSDNNTYYLSITGMILPSNDGFVGLDSLKVPTNPGTYTLLLNAYDAGTEGNDELNTGDDAGNPDNAGFPVPEPLMESVGENATGFELEAEGFVHIHRGILGDTDPEGGSSDMDSRVHRWLNPVARLIIAVE